MEIFCNELPKCCEQCKINCLKKQNNVSCFIADCDGCIGGRPKDCPLKLLSTRLAEERKKVVQEIRKYIEDKVYINELNETFIDEDIYKILDQIEENSNNKN